MTSESSGNIEHMTNNQQELNQAQDPNVVELAIEVSPTTLLDSNRYSCEICFRGFPRKQNLMLHQRAHNLPFTLIKARTPNDDPAPKRVYLCPEPTCVHHNRSHAIGDFGGLKKHYLRKHSTNKNYKCDTCSKAYSVQADLKAHTKTCATKCICLCGSRFSRDNFMAHQETCDAVKALSHPQTSGIQINSKESSSTQNQSDSYPSTTPYQSHFSQFGADNNNLMTYPSMGLNMNELHPAFISPTSTNQNHHGSYYAEMLMDKNALPNVNHEGMNAQGDYGNNYANWEGGKTVFGGGFMHDATSSSTLTPARRNVGLDEMFNHVTGASDVGGYQQGGYKVYGVGSGPLEYSGGMNHMFGFQHQQQQPLYNVNLGQDGIFNPMTGSSYMGSYEQSGYNSYGVGGANLNYSGGIEMFDFQQQQQQALHNVNLQDVNIHGDWGNTSGTAEGTRLYLDGGCMRDPSNSFNMKPVTLNLGLNDVAGSSGVDYSGQNVQLSTSAAASGESLAPSEMHFNQKGFWF